MKLKGKLYGEYMERREKKGLKRLWGAAAVGVDHSGTVVILPVWFGVLLFYLRKQVQ